MKVWAGVDPGADGAIALITENGDVKICELTDENLLQFCRDIKSNGNECICAVEDVASSPQMGVRSAFTFGMGFGKIIMALQCFDISFALVKPSRWKVELGCNIGKSATTAQKKKKDIEVCRHLYPNVSLKKTERCKTDSDGFADSVLLATYAKRKF